MKEHLILEWIMMFIFHYQLNAVVQSFYQCVRVRFLIHFSSFVSFSGTSTCRTFYFLLNGFTLQSQLFGLFRSFLFQTIFKKYYPLRIRLIIALAFDSSLSQWKLDFDSLPPLSLLIQPQKLATCIFCFLTYDNLQYI